jgi:hypothetical protein
MNNKRIILNYAYMMKNASIYTYLVGMICLQ